MFVRLMSMMTDVLYNLCLLCKIYSMSYQRMRDVCETYVNGHRCTVRLMFIVRYTVHLTIRMTDVCGT